jgi:hypothetical protein
MGVLVRMGVLLGTSRSHSQLHISAFGSGPSTAVTLPVANNTWAEMETKTICIIKFLAERKGVAASIRFLLDLHYATVDIRNLTEADLFKFSKRFIFLKEEHFKEILYGKSQCARSRLEEDDFLHRKDLNFNAIYVNGKHYPVELSTLDHVLFGAIRADQQLCLNAYSRHELSDNDDVYSFFMRLPETQPKSFYKLKKSIENEDFQPEFFEPDALVFLNENRK